MSAMKMHATPLPGLTIIETTPIADNRGRFVRVFCESELSGLRQNFHFPQINLSTTYRRGTVRGMHFQRPPSAEAKLIRCVRGKVFDVAVDLRAGSPTWLQWHSIELDEDSSRQIYIPEGFAHGFQALSDNAQLLYLHTASWSRADEGVLRHDDPSLSICWPLAPIDVSEKDASAALIASDFSGASA